MINSRNIIDLDPEPRDVCLRHCAESLRKGIQLIVTSTYRDFESQDALYSIGRTTKPGAKHVTQARGGQSWHNFKCAWDVVPIISGKPVWDAKDPVWAQVVAIGKSLGAEAGADWESFPDLPHFQVRPRLQGELISLVEAKARFLSKGTIFDI